MISYKNTIPYAIYNGFKFELSDGPYHILYFSENSSYLLDKSSLCFRKLDFRNVSVGSTMIPRVHINGETVNEYRMNEMILHNVKKNQTKKNLIIDSTEYTQKVEKQFSPMTYQNRYGEMIYKYIFNLFMADKINEKNKKILFYSVDKKKLKTDFTKNKFFIFLKKIKNREIFYDDLVLTIIHKNKTVYRVLMKDRKLDYERILYYIRNI